MAVNEAKKYEIQILLDLLFDYGRNAFNAGLLFNIDDRKSYRYTMKQLDNLREIMKYLKK